MIDPKKIEEMAKQIGTLIPSQLRQVVDDVEGKIKIILQQKLAQLDVISRDEFDVQRQVLARTREKVDLLEQQIQALLAERATTRRQEELPSSDQQ